MVGTWLVPRGQPLIDSVSLGAAAQRKCQVPRDRCTKAVSMKTISRLRHGNLACGAGRLLLARH